MVLCSMVMSAGPSRIWNRRPCPTKMPTLMFSKMLFVILTLESGTQGYGSGFAAVLMPAPELSIRL